MDTEPQRISPHEGPKTPPGNVTLDEIPLNAESHPARATEYVETAKSAALAATQNQQQTATALADAQTKLADLSAIATQAMALKTQIVDAQTVIATKSDHIQGAQEHADKVRGDLDRVLTAATQQVTEAEGHKSSVKAAADLSAELLATIRTTKGSVDTDAREIAEALETAKQSTAQTKDLAEKAASVQARIADYESRLTELEKQSVAQLETIVGLLPGATDAKG